MIMLIYRFCLAYNIHVQKLCKNAKANISLDNCFDIYCKFGYTQCSIFERETLHGNTTNYPSLLMGDAHNIRIRHTPNPPPPPRPPPPTQHCFPREITFKTVKVTLERNSNKHCYQFHIKQKAI